MPDLCEIPDDGAWPAACWAVFDDYDVIAEFNTELAGLNASALRKTEAGYDALVKGGELQQQLTNFYADLLEEERQMRFIDDLTYKAIILLGVLGAAL